MKYVKTIIIIGCIFIAFFFGFFSGCQYKSDNVGRAIKTAIDYTNRARDIFNELTESNRKQAETNRKLETTITDLTAIIDRSQSEITDATETIGKIEGTEQQRFTTINELKSNNQRARGIVDESLKILQAEDNNN